MPTSQNFNGGTATSRRSTISLIPILIGFIAALMILALYSIQSSFHWQDLDQKSKLPSPVIVKQSHEDFQRLMEQTKQLLNDMAAANTTLNADTLRDFKALTLEEKKIGEQSEVMEHEIERLETSLTQCTKSKYDAESARDSCKREYKDYQLHIRQHPPSEAMSSKAIKCPEVPINIESSQSVSLEDKKWLVIGIPTVARRDDLDYLLRALAAMVDQLPLDSDDPLYQKILIHVINMQVNNNPGHRHIIFDKAKGLYGPGSGSPFAGYFKFSEMLASEVEKDPIPGRDAQNDPGTPNLPGFLVRRQTRNIAYVMQRSLNLAKYYLFLEDDMMLCPHGFLAIQYLLKKASRYFPQWLAIRASYGMNGIFLHNSDVSIFAQYLLKHQRRRPPDHLVVEWYAGETTEAANHKQDRKNIGFKFNLFDHLGVISTLRPQQQTTFPRCYDLLVEPTVFQVEAYSPRDCPHDDIWPCTNTKRPTESSLIDWTSVMRRG
jgi:hypothetical protein